jgi:hypothetical protein
MARICTEEHCMAHRRTPEEGRDGLAADRDDAAERRDLLSEDRDEAADRRDNLAADRDTKDLRTAHDLAYRYQQLRRHVLDHFARIENTAIDPADWPDLTPAALDQLHALVAEHRRSAARSRSAIFTLLNELNAELCQHRTSRLAAGRDRRAAADNRHRSSQDRADSAEDRDRSAGDRNQAAIEREQADPTGTAGHECHDPPAEPVLDHVARALADSREQIADSRSRIESLLGLRNRSASAPDDRPRTADE